MTATIETYGSVWRRVSTFRGYGHAPRSAPPEIGATAVLMPERRLRWPSDEEAYARGEDVPMITVGTERCDDFVRARVAEIGRYYTEPGKSGWWVRYELLARARCWGRPVPASEVA